MFPEQRLTFTLSWNLPPAPPLPLNPTDKERSPKGGAGLAVVAIDPLTRAFELSAPSRSIHPSVGSAGICDSKVQLPQLGLPPTPAHKRRPTQVLLQGFPQTALALAWVQSVHVVAEAAQWVVSLFGWQVLPQRCDCPATQLVTHVPVLQLATPVGKLHGTLQPPQLLFVLVGVSQPSVSLATVAQLAKPALQPEVPVGTVQPPEALQVVAPALTLDKSVQLWPHAPQFVGVFRFWQTPPQQPWPLAQQMDPHCGPAVQVRQSVPEQTPLLQVIIATGEHVPVPLHVEASVLTPAMHDCGGGQAVPAV